MYEVLMFDGGLYRIRDFYETIDDLGGFIIQENRSQTMITVTMALPDEERGTIEELARQIGGEISDIPLGGTEIAVIGPTLGRHHMPHPICDIAEYMRRFGAITIVMGLARGKGRETAQISSDEKAIINEYDAAIFVLGNFKDCIEKEKSRLYEDIEVPVILVVGPDMDKPDHCEGFVSGVGRKCERMRKTDEIKKLDEIADTVESVIDQHRKELDEDPLFVHPAEIKQRIESLPAVKDNLRPAPIVLHLDGLRVKVPYEDIAQEIASIEIYGRRLDEIADITKSRLGNSTLIKIHSVARVMDQFP